MKEYQVSYRGNRLVTKDNIIDVLNELGYKPGGGGGGFMLKTVTNWYLLAGKDDEVTMPDIDIIGETNWKTEYEAPYPGKEHVWRFTDYCYEDETNLEVPYLHIYTTPELITIYTSGGGMGVEFAYSLFNKNVSVVDLNPWKQLESLPEGVDPADVPILSELPAPNASGYSLGNYIRVEEVYYEYSENRDELPRTIPVGDWTKDLNLSYGATQYLWMSQRKISASGDPGQWEKPIRLSGADGDPGADAFDTEFIYKRLGRKPTQDDNNSLRADNERWNDDYVPRDLGWTDNPQGVDNDDPTHKYEWMAYRTRIDSTHGDYDPNHPTWLWSNWSDIKIWAAYGEKGMDGDGIEYVYKREWSGKPEEVDHPSEDFIPTTDNPTPDAPSGPRFIYGEDLNTGQEGVGQSWNKGVYQIANTDPNDPNNWRPEGWEGGFNRWDSSYGTYNGQGEWVPKGWRDDPRGVDENHKKEYVSQRKRVNGVWGPFSTPTVWATFSKEHTVWIDEDTGEWYIDGKPTGHKADGKGIDLKGRVKFYDNNSKNNYLQEHLEDNLTQEQIDELTTLQDTEQRDQLTASNVGDCYVIDKGYGGPYQGHLFLYLGPDGTGWETHWYDFGEFQGDGSYIHIAWAHNVYIDSFTGVLMTPGFVTDRDPNNGSSIEYEWMGICTNYKSNDPEEDENYLYKWNYVHGKDGDNYEWVYIRTQKEITPIIKRQEDAHGNYIYDTYTNQDETPHQYQDDEYLPFVSNPIDVYQQVEGENVLKTAGCYPDNESSGDIYQFYDDPKGVNNTYRYEWKSQRKRENGIWGDFGKVSLNATYSNDGQGVIRSTVFKKSISKPQTPSPGEGSYTLPRPEGWDDGLPTEGTGSIWMTSRIFTSDQQPPQSNWSDPILFQDSETLDIEVSPQDKLASPLYPPVKYDEATAEHPCNSHNPEEQSGYDHSEDTPPGPKQLWFDPEQDAAYIAAHATEFNWMATRSRYIDPLNGVPKWRDWVIVLIKGETGANGKSFEHAYLAFPNTLGTPTLVSAKTGINTAPITAAIDGQGPWNWSLTTAGITVNSGESLWMTERWIQDTSVGSWEPPVRISGNGTPGEDAEDIQFIYKRSSTLPNDPDGADKPLSPQAVHQSKLPVTWYGDVENAGTLPNEYIWKPIGWNTTANGSWDDGWSWNSSRGAWNNEGEWIPDGWTDSPQGVDETPAHKYEWMCQRIKPRTNDPEHTNWGDWSKVFVWSAYGDTGMDGDGIEYIYTRTSNPTKPKRPRIATTQGETDYDNGENWNGGVINVSQTSTPDWQPKEYPGNNFHGWLGGTYNPQGEWIPGGSYDNQGNFVEGDWTDEPQGIGTFPNPNYNSDDPNSGEQNITYYREYVSQRKRVNGEWGDFSDPIAWSIKPQHFHINKDGEWEDEEGNTYGSAEGPQGQGIQLKGTVDVVTNSDKIPYMNEQGLENTNGLKSLQEVNPKLDPDHYGNIQPGDCYVVRRNRYLYVCLKNSGNWNEDRQDLETWEATLSPTNDDPNWESVGEFQGQPGEGSYMHIAWAASKDINPVDYSGTSYTVQGNNINFDQYGNITLIKKFLTRYEDKKPNTDYDWMGVCTDHDRDDPGSDFDLRLDNNNPYEEYSNYQTYAIANPNKFNWFKYKWNNVRGRDGDNYERVYLRTTDESPAPTLGDYHESTDTVTFDPYYDDEFPEVEGQPRTFQDPEYLPAIVGYRSEVNSEIGGGRCTDDPIGVNPTYRYEWMAERRKKLNTTTHQVEWFPFSPPSLWAKYSFNGNNGKSVQTRYVAVPKKTGLTIDQGYESALSPVSTVEGTPYTWQPNTSSYSSLSTGMYLWMTQRSTSDPDNDITTEWEIPIRLSGEDGKAGEDGADIEFVYLRNNDAASPPAPANPTAKNKSNNRTTPYYGDVEKVGNAWIPKTWDTANNGAWSNWEWYSSAGVWNNDGEWIPDGWSDNPKGVGFFTEQNENHQDVEVFYKYEWACQRTKSAGNNQDWTQWVGPFKWSAYGDTGMDGDGVEYVYLRWDSSTPLSTPSGPKLLRVAPGVSTTDIIPWTKGIEKVPNSDPVQWQPKSSDWDTATLGEFSSWDTTNSGYFNEQGEWIPIAKKRVTQDNVTTDQIITTGTEPNLQKVHWTDDPQGIGCFREGDRDVYYIREWVSMRKRINGEWGSFSEPKIWASFGSDVKIVGGQWIINGVPSGKAEGEDGQGVALKGSVEVLNDSDRRGYASAHDIADYTTVRSLQGVKPSVNDYSDLQIGDCYVVKDNGYLYTCIRNKDAYDVNNNPNGWIYSGESDANWWEASEGVPGPGQQNWAEVGEIQGAPGESSYTHIAWATDSAIERADDGTILLIEPFITRYEELDQDISYEWMGVCINEHKLDPPNDYDKELEEAGQPYGEYESYRKYAIANPDKFNWHLYKWNHVTGKDGSDYEKVYIKTKSETVEPYVDQTGYDDIESNAGHDNPADSEFYPKVLNYSSSSYSNPTFTDDPTGVSADWPYEWVTERRKKLNTTTQRMEWGEFYSPATLWATYSFDGITAYLTKSSDNLSIDAAGNAIGGLGTTTQDANFNPRFYTEVKIYDPKKKNNDNSYGGYLAYQSGTTPSSGHYVITSTTGTDCTANSYNGKVYIQSISSSVLKNKEKNSCSIAITAKIYGGKTFNFTYTVTFNRIPQTYLTYTLTNDSDTFTYRTKTGKYDGLPIATTLEVLSTDGTPQKLNESENISDGGYIQSLSVTSSLLANAYTSKTSHASRYKVNGSTLTTDNTSVDEEDGTLGIKSKTAYIYDSNDNYTNLKLVIKSNGEVLLDRDVTANLDVDLPDSSYSMEISCTAILGGVTYTSLKKVFKFTERNDATLYKLWLSGDTFNILPEGGYSPAENTFQVKVNVKDETGLSTVTPVSTNDWLVGNNVKVRYINGNPAITPENDTLLSLSNLSFSGINNNFFTVVIVEYNSNNQPVFYHDIETVDLVSPGISQTYVKVLEDKCIIECDKDGKILGDSNIIFRIRAQLMWGDTECLSYDTGNSSYIISEGFEYTTSSSNTTKPCLIGNIGTDSSYTPARWGLNLTFRPDKTLTSGTITIAVVGNFNGVTRSATKTISIEASRQGESGPPGPAGDFLATAFIRTNTDISQWQPIGLKTNENCPTGFSGTGHSISESWEDGIPEGNKTLWASTLVIKGDGSTNTNGWALPRKMMDTQYYDVEFALRQPNDGTPSDPSPDNRHKDGVASGYDGQIWFDPDDDAAYVEANHKNFYWRAERESNNGNTSNVWIVTRIKGESQPWVSLDHGMFTINLNSSGILESNQTLYVHSYLKVGDITQTVSYSDCSYSISPTNSGISVSPSAYSNGGVLWTINLTSGLSYSNTEITITLKNSTYTAVSENIVILFANKNQSQITSYIFKRSNTTPTKPSVGNYSEPGPNDLGSTLDWTGWSDGLVSGSYNLYMSSRIFTSDGQAPQQTAWTNPTKLTLTDSPTKRLRFSLADAFPGKPGDTGKYWYNLGGSYSLPGGKTIENMIWMATGTRANSSSSWSWNVVRIKGETAEAGRSIDSIWYKAFNTLDVTIPSITLTIEDLYAQGWNEGYIQPTRDNQYLWKFIRTAYIDPDSIDHKGLDLVQVWSENMINPNLLDDTEFFDDDHINAWYLRKGKEWYSTGVQEKTDYLRAGTSHFYSGLPYKEYYVKHKLNDESDTSGTISFLAQYIYNTGSDIRKITSNTWYTLSFLTYGQQTSNGVPVTKLTCDLSHITLASGTDIIWTERVGSGQLTTSTGESKVITFSSKNHWHTVTATFKIGDLPSSATGDNAERIEFKLSYLQTYEQYIWITRPKLEIGQVATEYIPGSAIRDPYPRLTVWAKEKQYYQGQLGEPYLDAVTYGTNWFRCRQTHISSNSNKPQIGQTTAYWEPANNLDFVVTDLLLAETGYIKNLVVGGLRTGKLGDPHVEMEGSSVKFFGRLGFPSIELDTDNDGVGILNFYDKNGSLLYNLGPGGLVYYNTQDSGWISNKDIKMKAFTNTQLGQTGPGLEFLACYESELSQYYLWKEGFTVVENANGTKIITYNIGKLNSSTGKRDRSEPSEYNNKYYRNKNEGTIEVTPTTGNSYSTTYPSGNFLSGWHIYRNDGYYTSGGETIDTGNGNLRLSSVIAYNYFDGQLAKSTNIYFQSISGYWMNALGQTKGGFGSNTTFGYFLNNYNG